MYKASKYVIDIMEVIYNNGSNMRLQLQGGLNSNAFARIRDKEVLSGCREVHNQWYG